MGIDILPFFIGGRNEQTFFRNKPGVGSVHVHGQLQFFDHFKPVIEYHQCQWFVQDGIEVFPVLVRDVSQAEPVVNIPELVVHDAKELSALDIVDLPVL